jgi:hypothetical protein
MNEYKIIKSSKTEKGIICHVVDTGDAQSKELLYATVQGGLSWPNQGAPGYYVILGQEHDVFRAGKHQRRRLRVLTEFESSNLGEFFKHLAEDTALLLCQSYYAEQGDLWKGYQTSLAEYCRSNQIAVHPSIDAAVFTENFGYGANLVREWLKDEALLIPQPSILRTQLSDGGAQESVFGDVSFAVQFYAISALRYVVTAFDYYSLGPSKPIRSGRRRDGRVI